MKKIEVDVLYGKLGNYLGVKCEIKFLKENFKVHYVEKKVFNRGDLTVDYIDFIRWLFSTHQTTEVIHGKRFMNLFSNNEYKFIFVNHKKENEIVENVYDVFEKAFHLTPYPIKKEYRIETFADMLLLYKRLIK